MGKKLIGFDIDGVLFPWHLYVWDELHGTGAIDYTFDYFWTEGWKEYDDDFWDKIVMEDRFIDGEPIYGAVDAVTTISEKYDVFYMTNRPFHLAGQTKLWLTEYRFPSAEKIIMTHDKRIMTKSLNPDYFVEDKPLNISWLKEMTKIIAIETPWNRKYLGSENGVLRVKSIQDVPKLIMNLEE